MRLGVCPFGWTGQFQGSPRFLKDDLSVEHPGRVLNATHRVALRYRQKHTLVFPEYVWPSGRAQLLQWIRQIRWGVVLRNDARLNVEVLGSAAHCHCEDRCSSAEQAKFGKGCAIPVLV